jgi:UDP-N-acetylmuramyl pentapeptide phosphotransferase/UDP-N-acetylglucosamine-1-phosphate transferase
MAWRSAALNFSDGLDLLEEAVFAITSAPFYLAFWTAYPECNLICL